MTKTPELTTADRAVYELVRQGAITEINAAMFERELKRLQARGVVAVEGGRYRDRAHDAQALALKAKPPKPTPTQSLVIRIPVAWHGLLQTMLEAHPELGDDKSDVARHALVDGIKAMAKTHPTKTLPKGWEEMLAWSPVRKRNGK